MYSHVIPGLQKAAALKLDDMVMGKTKETLKEVIA